MVKKSHFERFAKHYDFLTKILMLGTYWNVRKRIVNRPTEGAALDICSGTGYVTGHIAADKVVAIDMSPGMLSVNREKNKGREEIYFVSGDAFNLPFPDAIFDSVYWTLAAHEFKNAQEILKEVQRILKKNGHLILYDFSKPENLLLRYTYLPFLRHIVELGTFYVYDEVEWKEILSNVGFKAIKAETLYMTSLLISAQKV